jgi:glyoxylase-like metal-dependent hydrolase (beta-lactamase superfamily II)
MFFRQLYTKEATISYLFGCGGKGKGIAVDVVTGDEQWFIDQAEEQKTKITHVLDTHVHADHYSGGRKLAEMTGAEYCIHEFNKSRVKFDFSPLKDGDKIEAGNVVVEVLHTPGHTPDSVCYIVRDMRRGDHPWFMITGDTLFVGSLGRPDFGGPGSGWAADLYDSLHNKILAFPDDLEIFPGHQAGSVCGAGISGKPSSTIGFEKKFNKGLNIKSKEEFVEHILKDIPPRPAEMDEIVKFNLGLN